MASQAPLTLCTSHCATTPQNKAEVSCCLDKQGVPVAPAELRPLGEDQDDTQSCAVAVTARAGAGSLSQGFKLCCLNASCNFAWSEATSRRLLAQPYRTTTCERAGHAAGPGGGSQAGSSSSGSRAHQHAQAPRGQQRQPVAPLPELTATPQHALLLHMHTLQELLPRPAEFLPLQLHTWLSRPAAAAAGAASIGLQAALPTGIITHAGELGRRAAALSGVWRGTYGSHGVELLSLQLLLPPRSFSLYSQGSGTAAQQAAADNAARERAALALLQDSSTTALADEFAGVPGIEQLAAMRDAVAMMASAARTVAELAEVHAMMMLWAESGVAGTQGVLLSRLPGFAGGPPVQRTLSAGAADLALAQHHHGTHDIADGEAGGEAATAAAAALQAGEDDDDASALDRGAVMQQLRQRLRIAATQQQQLLLVATKLTGDVNVPAGRASFAVDLCSGVQEPGAPAPLLLPARISTDVSFHAPGVRRLRVQVGVIKAVMVQRSAVAVAVAGCSVRTQAIE